MKTPVVPKAATVGDNRPTASIIAFPSRTVPVGAPPEDRLTRSLQSLNTAMQEQRAAVAAWRDVLTALKATTVNLDASLQRYQSSLKSLNGSVSALQVKARALEQWATHTTADPRFMA